VQKSHNKANGYDVKGEGNMTLGYRGSP